MINKDTEHVIKQIACENFREQEHISNLLSEVQKLWTQYPQLRLMQLLLNAFSDETAAYYAEDEVLLSRLKAIYSQHDV